MPLLTPHWDVLKQNGLFRVEPGDGKDVRFNVLMSLFGRANQRLRCWPSVNTLMASVGVTHKHAVSGALGWLADHGAIYNVPVDKRLGKERGLLPQKYVFQLTGIIHLGGRAMEYVLFQSEERIALIKELRELGAEYPIRLYTLLNPPPAPDPEGEDDEVGADSDTQMDTVSGINLGAESDTQSSALLSSKKEAGGSRVARSSNSLGREPNTFVDEANQTPKTPSTRKQKIKRSKSTKLADYIEATLGIPLTAYQRDRLAKPVVYSAGTMKTTYMSPEDMYVEQRGFSEFVVSRVSSYKAREKFDNIDMVIGDIRKYDRKGDKGNPGWLEWKVKRWDLTAPLPWNAHVPIHQQREHENMLQAVVVSDELPRDPLDDYEDDPTIFEKPKRSYVPLTEAEYRKRFKLPPAPDGEDVQSDSMPSQDLDE